MSAAAKEEVKGQGVNKLLGPLLLHDFWSSEVNKKISELNGLFARLRKAIPGKNWEDLLLPSQEAVLQHVLSPSELTKFKKILDLAGIKKNPDAALSKGLAEKDVYLIILSVYYGARVYSDSEKDNPIFWAIEQNLEELAAFFVFARLGDADKFLSKALNHAVAKNREDVLSSMLVALTRNSSKGNFLPFFVELLQQTSERSVTNVISDETIFFFQDQVFRRQVTDEQVILFAECLFAEPVLSKLSHSIRFFDMTVEFIRNYANSPVSTKSSAAFLKILDAFYNKLLVTPPDYYKGSSRYYNQNLKQGYKLFFIQNILGDKENTAKDKMHLFLQLPTWFFDSAILNKPMVYADTRVDYGWGSRQVCLYDHYGETPLTYSCLFNKPLVETLLSHPEINVNARNGKNQTPLIVAVCGSSPSIATIKLLLNKNPDLSAKSANPNFPQQGEKTALEWAEFLFKPTGCYAQELTRIITLLRAKQAASLAAPAATARLASASQLDAKKAREGQSFSFFPLSTTPSTAYVYAEEEQAAEQSRPLTSHIGSASSALFVQPREIELQFMGELAARDQATQDETTAAAPF